jgi:hypothetical protein
LGQLERYQTLLEEQNDLATQELTKVYSFFSDLDEHIKELKGENYATPPWDRK